MVWGGGVATNFQLPVGKCKISEPESQSEISISGGGGGGNFQLLMPSPNLLKSKNKLKKSLCAKFSGKKVPGMSFDF